MLFKLVLTFIAAAHCLPKGYKKHAKSAERLHALEKELDALKHVAEPQMERRGAGLDKCDSLFGEVMEEAVEWFFEKADAISAFHKMRRTSASGDKSTINRFLGSVDLDHLTARGPNLLQACESFCKVVDPE